MTPLRILMAMDADPNPDSGAAGTELAIASHLRLQGHAVRNLWATDLPHRIRHWNLHHLVEQPEGYRRAISSALREFSADVLHVNQPAGWIAARENRKLARPILFVHRSHGFEPRIAAVLDGWRPIHEPDSRPWARRVATRVLQRLLRRNYRGIVTWADAHVVSCSECASDLVARGVRASRIHISPQVPVDAFLQSPAPGWSLARSRRILFVGQHAFMKAPVVVARALELILAAHPDATATWVCEASAHEAVRSRLGPAAAARTEILGWMPREALLRVYDEHGVFLFLSYTEGFGKVFLEAMARGLCVVATDQSGPRDVLRDGDNGFLVSVGAAEEVASKVAILLARPRLSERIARSARETAVGFTWSRIVRQMTDVYRTWLEEVRTERPGAARS